MTSSDKRAYPESCQVAENVRVLMARDRVSQEKLAEFLDVTSRTLRARFERPWEFRFVEVENIAKFFNVPIRDLTRPIKFGVS